MFNKKLLLGFITLIFTLTFIPIQVNAMDASYENIYKAKIIKLISDETKLLETSGGGYNRRTQVVEAVILDKDKKGEHITVTNTIDEIFSYSVELHLHDSIYVFPTSNENDTIWNFRDFCRDRTLLNLAIFTAILMLIVGAFKGFKSIITLAITIGGIYQLLVGIINGGNPIFLAVVISSLITIITILFVAGFNLKSLAAILGTIFGVVIAGIIAMILSKSSHLTGLASGEAQMLLYSAKNLNIPSILFASIIVGTLGAVMDVSMSIASSINEILKANPLMNTFGLFKSGMNIGRDIMGTMVNTLVLAYVGSSIFLILVFMVNNIDLIKIINMDLIATEIVRALAGTIGLICAIPITAAIAAILETKN